MRLPGVPPPRKRRKRRLTTLSEKPKIGDEGEILILLENGKIQLPQPRAQGHGVEKGPRKENSTMVGERARQNVHRRHMRHPSVRATDEVNAGSKGPIGPTPSKRRHTKVHFTPNIHNTTIRKQTRQHSGTFARVVKRARATAIHSAVEDRVEIATQKSGDSRINSINTTDKELITIRVTVRGLDTSHTEDGTTKSQFNQNKTTIKFTYHRPTFKNRTIQDSHATRVDRTERARAQKTKTRKPQLEINRRKSMCLL